MSVAHDINPWKRQNIDRKDIGPDIFDMCGASANIEQRAVRTSCNQSPVIIGIHEAESGFFIPDAISLDLAGISN